MWHSVHLRLSHPWLEACGHTFVRVGRRAAPISPLLPLIVQSIRIIPVSVAAVGGCRANPRDADGLNGFQAFKALTCNYGSKEEKKTTIRNPITPVITDHHAA